MKKCPYCAEEIQEDAVKCPHCGSALTTAESPAAFQPPVATATPSPGPAAAEPPTFSHSGQRYVLGYDSSSYGIWDRNTPGAPAVQAFPRTPGGWQQAWSGYSSLEPANAPVGAAFPPTGPYGQGPPGFAPQQAPSSTNGMAVASLVLGIIWIYWIGSILALVFGYIARKQIKESNGAQGGNGLAIAGIVLGWIGVALFVLTLLLAIAVPTFIGASARAQDRLAESNLRNGMAAAKTYFTDADSYTGADAAKLQAIEPSLNWTDATLALPNQVAVHGVTGQTIVLVTRSESGTTFCIADNVGVGTTSGTTYGTTNAQTPSECTGGWPA